MDDEVVDDDVVADDAKDVATMTVVDGIVLVVLTVDGTDVVVVDVVVDVETTAAVTGSPVTTKPKELELAKL